MTVTERAASVGAEYLREPEFEGVIFPEGCGCVWHNWLFPYWTPPRSLVMDAETRLAGFLESFNSNASTPQEDALHRYTAPLVLAMLPRYRRQYSGIVFDGRPMLHMNFFVGDGWGDWATHFVEVSDGGHYYFQTIYDPDQGDFVAFWVNGEA